jgi:hypothetical protein
MTSESDAGDAMADACCDTVRIRILPESMLPQSEDSAVPLRSFDPYSTGSGARSDHGSPRRTLDDMRRLSERIKRIRAGEK